MSDNSKKLVLIIFAFIVVVIAVPFFIFMNKEKRMSSPEPPTKIEKKGEIKESENIVISGLEASIESSRSLGRLPLGEEKIGFDFSQEDESTYIEYLSFFDFYEKIENDVNPSFSDYSLPLNVKTDVVNYYDISRRLNLDPYLDNLNSDGFSIVDNQLEAKNFYDIYDELYEKKIPIFLSSDFLIYYHQQAMKGIFKNIESNIFYKNLWDINFALYEKAKKRYENKLLEIGNLNDRVLEAERLVAAYFATSLELLKPETRQIAETGDLSNPNLFSFFEGDIYSFSLPDYLKVDVLKEVELIKAKNKISKSPVLLYDRDFKEFVVPDEYSINAKLNNFYLATKWLSSTFPLHYRGNDCLDCYLDFDDWRISIITSVFIANDIFNSHDLKNDWARIYKTLAFFKGLRGDLSYVHYRDALVDVFGDDYDIENIFDDSNPDSVENLYKLQAKILEYDFLDIEGAFDKNDPKDKPRLGVKMLADFYWPNDYIFDELSYPKVSLYKHASLPKNNVTGCNLEGEVVRCNGFSLDVMSLIFDESLDGNIYYKENSSYDNYKEQMSWLKKQVKTFPQIWHYNNYWQTLKIIKDYLESDKQRLPIFTKNLNWQTKELYTSVGAWINLQLPSDSLKVHQKFQRGAINSTDLSFIKNNYIEPNLDLVNEQLASTLMVYEMFSLLKVTEELRSVFMDLEDMKEKLEKVKVIMTKELEDEDLSMEELSFISVFAREYKTEKQEIKKLEIEGRNNKKINYDISKPKLIITIFRRNNNNYFSVGPIFSYTEK